jgi:hypothetical protein
MYILLFFLYWGLLPSPTQLLPLCGRAVFSFVNIILPATYISVVLLHGILAVGLEAALPTTTMTGTPPFKLL